MRVVFNHSKNLVLDQKVEVAITDQWSSDHTIVYTIRLVAKSKNAHVTSMTITNPLCGFLGDLKMRGQGEHRVYNHNVEYWFEIWDSDRSTPSSSSRSSSSQPPDH